jgi:hypothetical protein
MSQATSPYPDTGPAGVPAAASESSQLAGIRELLRIAELQAQAYARAALIEAVLAAESPTITPD